MHHALDIKDPERGIRTSMAMRVSGPIRLSVVMKAIVRHILRGQLSAGGIKP